MSHFRKGLVALSILSILLPPVSAFAQPAPLPGVVSASAYVAAGDSTPEVPQQPAAAPARVAVASAPPAPPPPPAQAWVNPPLPRGLVLARGDHWACQGRSQQIRCGVMTQNNTRWRTDVPFYWYTYDGVYVGSNPAQVGIGQAVYAPAQVQPAAYVQPAPSPQPPAPQEPTFDQQMQRAQWEASPNTRDQERRGEGPPISRRVTCERTQSGPGSMQCTEQVRQPSAGERIGTGVGVAAILGTLFLISRSGNRCGRC